MNNEQIAERIEVLVALDRTLRARLLNVREPEHMQAHIAKLRADAQVLLDLADRIQSEQTHDMLQQRKIRQQLVDCANELDLLRMCQRKGLKPKQIRRILQLLAKEKENEDKMDV
jgi:hypothetical protein